MSNYPPYPEYHQAQAFPSPRRANGAAIASLVLGLAGCVPAVTGLLAVVLGIIGLRRTRDEMVGGRGLAVAGLVLGSVSLIFWLLAGPLFGIAIYRMESNKSSAKLFVQDLQAGNIPAARSLSTSKISDGTLAQVQASLQGHGAITRMTIADYHLNMNKPGHPREVTVLVEYPAATVRVELEMLPAGGGKTLIDSVTIR